MEKDKLFEILNTALRLLLMLIIGTVVIFILLICMFDGTEVTDLLFSSEQRAEVILFLVIFWLFAVLLGAITAASFFGPLHFETKKDFENMLAKKQSRLDKALGEVQYLRRKLNQIYKNHENASADRILARIDPLSSNDEGPESGGNTSTDDTIEIKTLQEELRQQSKARSSKPDGK